MAGSQDGRQGLDALDRKIMYELDLNARASASALAKRLRRSKETINFRLNRLVRQGWIKGFYTVFNTSALGLFYVKAYLKFKDAAPKKESEIFSYMSGQSHVAYLASLEGRYDAVALVMVRSMAQADGFFSAFMKRYGAYVQEKDVCVFLATHRLNQKFLYAGGKSADWTYPYELGGKRLDKEDMGILESIQSNARLPIIGIAKAAGITPASAKYRLKRLEKEGIILAYVTSPNFDMLGLQFAQINISLNDPSARKEIMAYFDSTNKCLFAIEMLGKYDVLAEVHVQSQQELREIIAKFKERFVGKYNDYDVSTITKEYVVVWGPVGEKK
ncbi:MAG: winged helix-turn-helix transcriptional regulator [Candidatus Micrarchaeia archaeon]